MTGWPAGTGASHGILDLQHQRDPGRLRRPPGGDRRRGDARLLHPPHGRGRGHAVGTRHLRDDGELLAGGSPRRRGGAAGVARVGGQAGCQAEVRSVVDANVLPMDQQPPHRRRPAHGRAAAQGRDAGGRAPRQRPARDRAGPAGPDRRVPIPRASAHRRSRPARRPSCSGSRCPRQSPAPAPRGSAR